ncbi:MAG: DUF4184 family protein, partial [Actinomycetota bacterium]|nr:DUF4184 family protein [Actinomycetota bacterium]
MPFTPSHVAAVLPLLRTPLPASALVAGSIAPDVPYYLPVLLGLPTHSALAVVTTDVVLGALAWLLWHALVAAPALAAAPAPLRARLSGRVELGVVRRVDSAQRVIALVLGLVVGAATHVGWDEFSHEGRWGTEHISQLGADWYGLAGYRWVQYASAVLGGAVLAGWLARWWRRTRPVPVPPAPVPRWIWLAPPAAGLV